MSSTNELDSRQFRSKATDPCIFTAVGIDNIDMSVFNQTKQGKNGSKVTFSFEREMKNFKPHLLSPLAQNRLFACCQKKLVIFFPQSDHLRKNSYLLSAPSCGPLRMKHSYRFHGSPVIEIFGIERCFVEKRDVIRLVMLIQPTFLFQRFFEA